MPKTDTYTLVQHSGFVAGGNPGFERAVELHWVTNAADRRRVERAGGLLFTSYRECDDAEYTINYPDDNGVYPHVEGTFGTRIDDGRPVYIPSPGDRYRLTPALVVFS